LGRRERLAAVPSYAVPVELLAQDHGRPANVRSVLVDRLSEGKLPQDQPCFLSFGCHCGSGAVG
jgi:hypothetical protein